MLRQSLAKAILFDADADAGAAPAATLAADVAGASGGSNGDSPGADDGNKGDGTPPEWLTSMPKEFRDNKALSKHSELSGFLKESLENSNKLEGFDSEKVLNLLGDDASDDDKEAFHRKLGKPESAEGYVLNDPELPADLARDEALEGQFKAWALKANMSTDALNSFTADFYAHYAAEFEAAKAENEKDMLAKTNALKVEQGDKYTEFVNKAVRVANQFGGDEFIQLLKDSGGLESHPTFINVFGKIGGLISEDSALGGGSGAGEDDSRPKGRDGQDRFTYPSLGEDK